MQKILRYAYDIVLFTFNGFFFSFIEAVNLNANIDCTIKLKWHFNQHTSLHDFTLLQSHVQQD